MTLKNVFDKVKPKVNLDYFDQDYFEETFLVSFAETLVETYRNMTDSEREKLKQIAMQSIKKTHGKFVRSTDEVTSEVLDVLEKRQRKFTMLANVFKTAMTSIEKSS